MLDLYPGARKQLLKNLIIAGTLISLLTGVTVAYIEFKRADKQIADIALKASQNLANQYIAFHSGRTELSYINLQRAILNKLEQGVFISIEFLDENLDLVINEVSPSLAPPPTSLLNKFRQFEMKGQMEHQLVLYGGQIYIKIMSPIKERSQQKSVGHFQVVYHLSEDQMASIQRQSYNGIILSLLVAVFTTLSIYPVVSRLYKKLVQRSGEVITADIEILKSLGSAVAQRDSDTSVHNYRVTCIAVNIAEEMGVAPSAVRSLIKGAFLHDVGKIGVTDAILLKPGKLTGEEFEEMKKHVQIGAEIIRSSNWLHDALDVILFHHERYDGTGYPEGRKREGIPLAARIFAVADVFDALCSRRPYKRAFAYVEALSILKESSGSHFDPAVFCLFEQIAARLYDEIFIEGDEKVVEEQLDNLLQKYFTITF